MGDATVTRDQFSATKSVNRKIFQTGTFIADADANEVGQICEYRNAWILNELLVKDQFRFGTGWAVTGGTNSTTVAAGVAAIEISADKSYLLKLSASSAVTGWTTPSGGNRTDILYVDVAILIKDAADDATLVNPAVGKETAVDERISFTFVKLQGTVGGGTPSLPTPPANHYYVTIATIARINGQATINNGDITNSLRIWVPLVANESAAISGLTVTGASTFTGTTIVNALNLSQIETIIWVHAIQAPYGSAQALVDWVDADPYLGSITTEGLSSGGAYHKRLRVPFVKKPNYNNVKIKYEGIRNTAAAAGTAKWTISGTPGQDSFTTSWAAYEQIISVSGLTNGTLYDVLLEMNMTNSGIAAVRKVVITGAL